MKKPDKGKGPGGAKHPPRTFANERIPMVQKARTSLINRNIYYKPTEWDVVNKALAQNYRKHSTQAKKLMLEWALQDKG